ncbi:hypothetical protein L1987_15279 [Smallanthus sonchifolius]|uniref:Uncharacterized protein n=1 Tax=Smallanthus sonchifolius TaxID=185202 RepID=A0ACB9J759_9ASTR|nr:hypothetical protein L1987_15279 [Smallanthus sonchifolius]
MARVGEVAYRLELPDELSGIHPTFHVSHLRKSEVTLLDLCLGQPILAYQMARHVEYKHNQFWDTVHSYTDVEPHVLRATVNNTKIAISEDTIRAALTLGGAAEDPISYPNPLIIGCFQRMGYRGCPNDTQSRKGGLVGEWRYFMHVIIQCLSPRKAGTDGLKTALQAAMVALTLNKRFNFARYIYREMVMQITHAEGQGFLMYPRFI